MERTQIYLGAEELALLDRASARTGASRSELIRRAIRTQYGSRDLEARRADLLASFGAWRDRDFTGREYVRDRRKATRARARRLGRGRE